MKVPEMNSPWYEYLNSPWYKVRRWKVLESSAVWWFKCCVSQCMVYLPYSFSWLCMYGLCALCKIDLCIKLWKLLINYCFPGLTDDIIIINGTAGGLDIVNTHRCAIIRLVNSFVNICLYNNACQAKFYITLDLKVSDNLCVLHHHCFFYCKPTLLYAAILDQLAYFQFADFLLYLLF